MKNFRNSRIPGWSLLIAAAFSPHCFAQKDLRGVYVYTNDVSQLSQVTAAQLTASFNVAGVDGVAVVIGWNAIEPSLGQYQWATLDSWISQAISLGKKIDLVVPAGQSAPAWLFQPPPMGAGAVGLNFTVSPHAGETGVCDPVTLPPPWDSAFLSQWDSMLAALAAHLKSVGTYDAVTLLRITGINRTTEELRLPAETAESTGLACVSDSLATWQNAGYRPSLLLQGWNAVVSSFMKSFPDKSFSVSIIPNDAFPGIAENGSLVTGKIGDENEPLLTAASQALPGRLVVQFDFLMPGVVASQVVTGAAQNLGTFAAFQTNEYLGKNGAGCSEPITSTVPCADDTYLALLETGIYPLGQSNPLRSQYIEVFHANASAFPDDILEAHTQLVPPISTPQSLSGLWYDPLYSGSGFNILMSSVGLLITYYGWDDAHNRLWLAADIGPTQVTPGTPFTLNMNQTAGGSFSSPAPSSTNTVWGTLTLTFTSCSAATAVLSGKDGTQSLSLHQLAGVVTLPSC